MDMDMDFGAVPMGGMGEDFMAAMAEDFMAAMAEDSMAVMVEVSVLVEEFILSIDRITGSHYQFLFHYRFSRL